ncbi:signal peptide peptidase SppA [Celerinatantimonas diazotrophica]|uniref:Protease-4 n=1 Tax=Celerinatantimonas diazotrophica TaxID=412034 RepID=A0A4R1JM63_9GAMM|nr:signal peptide peptidase SppA [Celerinatantimonas diazotrophica]TCK52040.1 protease-4 [Celerinatantimonas diazotrophica]CAG9296257.1 Protease 4 [Celerinatantimonas diazotrophica]
MKILFRLIGKLLKYAWRTINFVRQFIVNIFFFAIIIAVIVAFNHQGHQKPTPELTGRNALTINLDGKLVEQPRKISDITRLVQKYLGAQLPQEIGIHQLAHTIEQAKSDPNINGIVLNLNDLQHSGLSKLQTVGQALNDFKTSGKPVIAIADNYDQGQYFLASFATQIILNPAGAVMIKGLSANELFYKDALDKLGIHMHVFRVGIYKSFVEPYIRNNMSKPAREDLTRWVGKIWHDYTEQVAKNRQITTEDVAPSGAELLAKLKAVDGNAAQYALNNKLVDHLFTRDETKQYLIHLFGGDNHGDYNYITLNHYQPLKPPLYQSLNSSQPQIAVLNASGPIVSGSGTNGVIASDDMIEALDKVQHDANIKALVLRVDSPGGSAFAAELIRSKLASVQKAGKPVIVSMGSTAASGGYWISSTSDHIFAQSSTITGSIGIFGMFATAEDGLGKLGIHTDGVATTDYATVTPLAPLPDDVAKILQLNVENGYHQFVSLVEKGRHFKSFNAVNKIAQGRIWTGREAKSIGLVDSIGGLNSAIKYAAKKVHLTHYALVHIDTSGSTPEHIVAQILDSQAGQWLSSTLPWLPSLASIKTQTPLVLLKQDPKHLFSYCSLCRNPL